jgi:hypothetical protein
VADSSRTCGKPPSPMQVPLASRARASVPSAQPVRRVRLSETGQRHRLAAPDRTEEEPVPLSHPRSTSILGWAA